MTAVRATERRLGAWRGGAATAAALVRRHRALAALLALGAALRIVALAAVYPGIWFPDSDIYIRAGAAHTLSVVRVVGYSLVVEPFRQLGSAGALIGLQHLVGLALAVLVYALLRRRGVREGLALLAVVPLVLDAYLIEVEHTIMPETAFHAALLGSVALLLWNERLGLGSAAGAGLLLGYASVTRPVAVPFIAIALAYLFLRRVGWRPLAVFLLGWAVVAAGYATVYQLQHGSFGFTSYSSRFLYAKVAEFADCSRLHGLPSDERAFCPDPHARLTPNGYLWGARSPIAAAPMSADGRIRDFDVRAIADRPLAYAGSVLGPFLHYFEPGHRIGRTDYSDKPWRFPDDPAVPQPYPGYQGPIRPAAAHPAPLSPSPAIDRMAGRPRTSAGASRLLHGYQGFAYTPGPLLAICLLVVLAALVARRGAWRLRIDAALLAALVVAALGTAAALSGFSYRYGLIAVVALPPAAALAATALMGRRQAPPRSGSA